MVFFPAVQAVLNAERAPETNAISPVGNTLSRSSSNGDLSRPGSGQAQAQAQAGPGPSTSSNSARFAPMHEQVGVTMPPPQGPIRKQNIACDACRSRKIRCQRVSIHQIVCPRPILPHPHPPPCYTCTIVIEMGREWEEKCRRPSVSNAK